MSKIRKEMLARTLTCDYCGEYVAYCTCTSSNGTQVCPACEEHPADCECADEVVPITLTLQDLRPAMS
jgi:hypothetical protein